MVAWDLLNANCCCPCQHSHSSGRLWHRLTEKGTSSTDTSVLGVLSALYRARGPEFPSDHIKNFVPELSAKWLPGWPFSVASVMGAALQRRLLFFITCSDLLQKQEQESGLLCLCAVPSIHTPAVISQVEQDDQWQNRGTKTSICLILDGFAQAYVLQKWAGCY